MKVNLLSGKGDKYGDQSKQIENRFKNKQPSNRWKKKDGSIFCFTKETCEVGILEDHDNEVRQELYDDIRKKLLG